MQAGETRVETSNIRGLENILADVTRRLYARIELGKAVIVTDRPLAAQTVLKRFWLRLSQKLQAERGESYDAALILDLTHTIARLQSVRFTTLAPFEQPQSDVFLMTPEGLTDILPECATLFVMTTVNEADLEDAMACLLPTGTVVRYGSTRLQR